MGLFPETQEQKNRIKSYYPTVVYAVRKIAKSMDYFCVERFKPNLVWIAELLQIHENLRLNDSLKDKLASISVSATH